MGGVMNTREAEACAHEWNRVAPGACGLKCRLCGAIYESQQERVAREETKQALGDYYAGKGQKFYGMP